MRDRASDSDISDLFPLEREGRVRLPCFERTWWLSPKGTGAFGTVGTPHPEQYFSQVRKWFWNRPCTYDDVNSGTAVIS